jgi:hypothetical protein
MLCDFNARLCSLALALAGDVMLDSNYVEDYRGDHDQTYRGCRD